MKWKRLLRDTAILVAFSGAFYFVVVFVNNLDGNTGNDNNDFSYTRKQADLMLSRQDWRRAASQFKKLTDKDPYDGRAWYMQAHCYNELRRDALRSLNSLSSSTETDTESIDAARRQAREQGDLAIEHYLIAREFARYRKDSLFQAAIIQCNQGDFEYALDSLKEFVDQGYITKGGLVDDPRFGRGRPSLLVLPPEEVPASAKLHAEPRFWAIRRKELANSTRR